MIAQITLSIAALALLGVLVWLAWDHPDRTWERSWERFWRRK